MACNFSIPFSGTAQDVLNRAKAAVQSQNGTFAGDAMAGNFQVSILGNAIAGSYTTGGQLLHIVISSKPFFVPCSTIENFLKSQIR